MGLLRQLRAISPRRTSMESLGPNLLVNTDRHRRAFGPAGRPVTLIR